MGSSKSHGHGPEGVPRNRPRVSVIVPCRNEEAYIRSFLDDVLRQRLVPGGMEVIVADGDSDDGTRKVLDRYAAETQRLQVISNPEKTVSTGLNRAILIARGEFIIRMDVHTSYADDYCRKCIEVIERTGAANVGGAARTRASGLRAEAIAAAYGSRFAVGGAKFHFADHEGEVDTVTYGCWRRSTLVEIGLFDENLVRNQDDELSFRLRRAGGLIWQDPSIRSWYHPRDSFGRLFLQYYQYGYWKPVVIRKHGSPASLRHLVPAGFVLVGIMTLVCGVFWRPAIWAFVTWIVTYGLFVGAGSISVAKRRGWGLMPLLPAAFACFHFGYGFGFMQGIFFPPRGRAGRSVVDLTR